MSCRLIVFIPLSFCVIGCSNSSDFVIGKTTLDSVIQTESRRNPNAIAQINKWPTPEFSTENLSFTGPQATSSVYAAQNGVLIGINRDPAPSEKSVGYWVQTANRNNWSYSVTRAEPEACGHVSDEILRIPSQGITVRYNSATGTVERVTESESRRAH